MERCLCGYQHFYSNSMHLFKMWMTCDDMQWLGDIWYISLSKCAPLTLSKLESTGLSVSCIVALKSKSHKSNPSLWDVPPTLSPLQLHQDSSVSNWHPQTCCLWPGMQLEAQHVEYKMNYKESQFPSSCKLDAGFFRSLKGLIVRR